MDFLWKNFIYTAKNTKYFAAFIFLELFIHKFDHQCASCRRRDNLEHASLHFGWYSEMYLFPSLLGNILRWLNSTELCDYWNNIYSSVSYIYLPSAQPSHSLRFTFVVDRIYILLPQMRYITRCLTYYLFLMFSCPRFSADHELHTRDNATREHELHTQWHFLNKGVFTITPFRTSYSKRTFMKFYILPLFLWKWQIPVWFYPTSYQFAWICCLEISPSTDHDILGINMHLFNLIFELWFFRF